MCMKYYVGYSIVYFIVPSLSPLRALLQQIGHQKVQYFQMASHYIFTHPGKNQCPVRKTQKQEKDAIYVSSFYPPAFLGPLGKDGAFGLRREKRDIYCNSY
jgi:hypothetical protein